MPGLPQGPMLGIITEGVVVARRLVNDPNNKNRYDDEYDVDPLWPGMARIFNAILASNIGYENGEEVHLRPATKPLLGGTALYDSTPRLHTDGDRVLVQFVNGNPRRPVITHVLSNQQASWRTKKDDFTGPHRRMRQNGTQVLYDASGNILVTLGDGTEPSIAAADKTVTLVLDTNTTIELSKTRLQITVSGTQVLDVTADLVSVFNAAKRVAREDDSITIDGTSDAQFVGWMAAVDVALKALALLTVAPLTPIGAAGAAYQTALTALGMAASPGSASGRISDGSDKLKTE